MVPIYEQGKGRGIGYGRETFADRFASLCREHLEDGRARAFAFIFYDFGDDEFRRVLNDQGVFTQLDRLAGSNLSVFYLHSGGARAINRFNTDFLARLGVGEDVALPCVVFFKLKDGKIDDVVIAHLESADLIHGFRELFEVIAQYIASNPAAPPQAPKHFRWVKSGAKMIGIEGFKVLLHEALSKMF
jgi:hypothetical protein